MLLCQLLMMLSPSRRNECDKKKTRRRKTLAPTPMVETSVHRCTRGSVKRDGFKPVFQELQSQPKKKKPRCKPFVATVSDEDGGQDKDAAGPQNEVGATLGDVPPPTPIKTIQQIDLDLGIAPEKLTVDRLMANPADDSKSSADD